jgi:hypothetical protein
MRQKFPGVAVLCHRAWTESSKVWDCFKGQWVEFTMPGATYSQATQAYMDKAYAYLPGVQKRKRKHEARNRKRSRRRNLCLQRRRETPQEGGAESGFSNEEVSRGSIG